jgi:hypothetical protein
MAESNWQTKPHAVLVTIANIGGATAGESVGSYACRTEPSEKGSSFGFATEFHVPSLIPKQKFKILLDCGDKARITGAMVDSEKNLDESNENNNELLFADLKIKTSRVRQ